MAIKCKCCGHVAEEYGVAVLSLEYLEQHVADFCKRPIEAISSISEFAKDVRVRGLFFHAARRFGGVTYQRIAKIYPTTQHSVSRTVISTKKRDPSAFHLLDRELKSVLEKINIRA